MNDKLRKFIQFLAWLWIFTCSMLTFGMAMALVSKGVIDTIGFIALFTVSLYSLEKNRNG